MPAAADQVRDAIDSIYRRESRRVFAPLVRLLGDFDLAEEALHDAFAAAMKMPRWKKSPNGSRVIPQRRRQSRKAA